MVDLRQDRVGDPEGPLHGHHAASQARVGCSGCSFAAARLDGRCASAPHGLFDHDDDGQSLQQTVGRRALGPDRRCLQPER